MKRIFLYLLFSIVFLDGAFAQKQFLDDALSLSSSINLPQPLTTVTYTCNVGVDTLIFTISETDLICNNDNSGTATVTIIKGTPPYNYLWSNGQTTTVATGFSAGNKNVEVFDAAGNDCVGFININEPGALIISSVTLINASCASVCDGSATASISGGTLPYTYLWTPIGQATQSAINLCAGSYSISVTDNHGCLANKKVTITQPVLLLANGSSSNISCFGACNGSVSAAPTGGTPPYTYSWNTGATTSSIAGRCPGTYTCTVRDSKTCVDTYITTITEPPLLTVSVTGTNLVCNGVCTGSVTATASGGTGAYTYSWAPGGSTSAAVTGLCAGTYTLTLTDGNACSKTATITLTQPTAVTAAPTGTNINCFNQCDGTVRANAGGGTSPYTYNWSPGGCTTSACSNLCFGTYTVNVNDANSCAISRTVTLTQPALLTVAPSNTNVTCSGFCNGSVTATAAGGTSPYTYLWLPGGYTTSARAGLCAGDYSITVTDTKGCTATGSVTITSPLPLLSNLSSTGTSCFGVCDGSVSSAASGGTIPYTYNWSNGKTTSSCSGICAGTYTLTLRDSQGCIATNTISVSQPNIFTASISSASPNPLNCNGDCNGTAVVTPNGGTAPYSYLWSTGATATTPSVTGLCAGIYNVNLTDLNGCTASVSITFSQPNTLSVTVASSNPTCSGGCNGSISAIAGGGTPGYTFSWLPGGQTTSTIASLCVEDYTLTVTDSKGCTNIQTVTLSTAFPLIANASVVTNVSCSGSCDGSVTANPTGGSPPFSYLWTGGSTAQTVTGLCAGTFSVTVTDANGCTNIDIVTITQPSVLSSSIASTTSSCSLCTGTASVTTSGGTAPYTYLWTPSGQTTDAAVGLCIGTYSVNVTDANGCTNSIAAVIPPVVTLTVTVSGTSVNCAGSCDGLATATPFGGNNPYTYMWSPSGQTTQSVTGFCAGTYTVNVADANGCISANTLSFSDPPALSVAMDSTDASCGICNGTATATPSGGTGSYTYTWSGFPVQTTATATGLCSGNYTVTVEDSNNCTITNTITVGNIPSISDNPSITLANCGLSDGSICVAPTGGTTPYTYAWAPGGATTACITGLPSGIYTVTITDAVACAGTFPIGVGNATGPTVNVTSSSNPSCNGYCNGSITVSASAATPPYTFLWTPGGETTNSITGLCSDTYIVQVQDAVPCTTFATVILTDPAPIVSNPSATNVSCNGGNNGSICLAPSGGTGPYTFSWSNGQTTACATGLIAGTYTVAFSDASGCSDTISIPISEPSLLSVTLASSNVTCNGMGNGTATATVTGGTTAYAYAWSTGSPLSSIVGLVPGNYSITVTDNKGCTATATVAITQPTALTTTISSTNVSCNSLCDGTATLTTAGGNLPYSYFWLPGGETTLSITGLCVGNYDGTITDALGCSSSKSVAITQPPVLSVSVIAVDASCFGGCNGTASANASGGTGIYTYDWNPGGATTSSVTGLCAGSYTLSLADANGCVVNDLFSISSPTQIQANITNTSPSCFGGCNGTATSAPVGGSAPYTYLWNNGQTNATATGLCAGTYTLTLFDANGCSIAQTTNVSDPVPITVSTGVADATCLICNGSITVISSGGTGPYSYSWNSGQTSANITGLCAGVYVVTVTDAIGCTAVDSIAVSNTSGPSLVTNGTNSSCFGFCNGTSTVTATGDGPPWN
ncbi:MAG: SprB repeat-containing protein, partial [Bacteroidetes bacterium]|nr:SprB repeat-containing protein [Bacteroidota bacterium]